MILEGGAAPCERGTPVAHLALTPRPQNSLPTLHLGANLEQIQGYLAHKRTPTPFGTYLDPMKGS